MCICLIGREGVHYNVLNHALNNGLNDVFFFGHNNVFNTLFGGA